MFSTIIIVAIFFILITLRVPLAFSIGITTFIYAAYVGSDFLTLTLDLYSSMNKFALLSVPLFILAGSIMATGGVAKRILGFFDEIVGHIYGSLTVVTIFSCLFFGGLSGAAPATTAAIGAIMIPAMVKQGYAAPFAAGVVACAGVLAVIIPPSNPMIVYALSLQGVSIRDMFLAGFIPGILLACCMVIPAYLVARKNGYGSGRQRGTMKSILKSAWYAKWALLTPVIILGGIYSGIFTPTESAAFTCIYAFIIGLWIHKDFGLKDVPRILRQALIPIVTVMLLLTFATTLGILLANENVPQVLARQISGITSSPIGTILIINALLLFVGCFMDTLAAITILAPLLYPIVQDLGISPVHFGMIMIVNLGVGFVTPPFGGDLFIANQISGTRIQDVFKGALPLIFGMIIALLIVTFAPFLSEILPRLFRIY
ncbi:MAG: TRAP transporter large permease [bacterium]|nr:TRAP transporter large permease [bacterium]